MNRGASISVVVPVFNAASTLARCLDALLAQSLTQEQYEVLLVDNGSTDDSVAIARRYPQVQLLNGPPRNPYSARNCGIAAARGDIIAFTDPDCVPDRDWLEKIAAVLAEPSVAIVLGRRCLPAGSTMVALLEAYEIAKDEYVLNSQIPALYYGYTNNMAVRKTVLTAIGSFIIRPRGADTIFVRQVVDAYSTQAVRYCPDMVVNHLELTGISVYYHKVFNYGRHRRANNQITFARALNTKQRLEIFRRAVRARHLSTWQAGQLLLVLVIGAFAWHLGSAWGQIRRPFTGGAKASTPAPTSVPGR